MNALQVPRPAKNRYTFTRCVELKKAQILDACSSRASFRELLDHLAAISKPADGAPVILLLLARLSSMPWDWLGGDLRVELEAIGPATSVTLTTELAGELVEKIFPTIVLAAPLAEFAAAVERGPHLILPLVAMRTQTSLFLCPTERTRTSRSAPRPTSEDG